MVNAMRVYMSRIFKCDARTLFSAIGEGMLFKAAGAKLDKSKIDFREGGKFHIEWDAAGPVEGVVQEYKPSTRMTLTWNFTAKDTQKKVNSNLTLLLQENNGKSTLTLQQDGFQSAAQMDSHHEFWDSALTGLHNSFRELFAKLEKNANGLDLCCKMKKNFHAPRAQVFKAVVDHHELEKYFRVKSGGPLVEGKKVEWKFKGHEPFHLDIHQVIEGELIKFQWGEAHVCFSFREKPSGETEIALEATGWKADQKGLDASYAECEGWMEFLTLLKIHVEKD